MIQAIHYTHTYGNINPSITIEKVVENEKNQLNITIGHLYESAFLCYESCKEFNQLPIIRAQMKTEAKVFSKLNYEYNDPYLKLACKYANELNKAHCKFIDYYMKQSLVKAFTTS
jgi:hypothetical protein